MIPALSYYFFFGQLIFLLIFLVPFVGYLIWSISLLLLESLFFQRPDARQNLRLFLPAIVKISLAFLLIFGAIAFGMSQWVTYYPQARADIPAINNMLMRADKYLFGAYVPFWFHQTDNPLKVYFDTAAPLLIHTYNSLSLGLGLTFLFLLLCRQSQFIRMFSSFALSLVISLPLWYQFPALSPLDGYVHPLIAAAVPEDIQWTLNRFAPSSATQQWIDQIVALGARRPGSFLPITTIPSMHIVWAALIVYFPALAWRPSLFLSVPYLLLNLVATVYTLQHYAVDLLATIPLVAVVIAAAHLISPRKVQSLTILFNLIDGDIRRIRTSAHSLFVSR